MASFQPSESDVETLISMTGGAVDRQEAIQRLKGNNNNVEQAIGEYFDNPDTNKYSNHWDESQFNAGRDGSANDHGVSFSVQGPDEPAPLHYATTSAQWPDSAPSRPPSRTSHNKSPLANPNASLTQDQLHDREMEQAIQASLENSSSQAPRPQETGVTGTDRVHFGPAERPVYEAGNWDMVRTSGYEIFTTPEPAERKRIPGAPAFLKPSQSQYNRVGPLITIYHEIPAARNAFLNAGDVLDSYGHNKEWWDGKAIELPVITSDNEPVQSEVDRELQRLMAFLDKTERSYGSADTLAALNEVKKVYRDVGYGQTIERAVLWAWRATKLITNPDVTRLLFLEGTMNESTEGSGDSLAILDVELPAKDSTHDTLYDTLDDLLWGAELNCSDTSKVAYLSHLSEVIVFRIEEIPGSKKIDIPAIWYPDRYLKAARQAAIKMKLDKQETLDEIERLDKIEARLTNAPLRTGKIVKVKDMFNAALRHDEAEPRDDNTEDNDMLSDGRPSKPISKLSADLQRVVASIDRKLLDLAEARQRAEAELRSLSTLFTDPTKHPNDPPLHKYTLRGVINSDNTTYVCKREKMLWDMEKDGEGLNAQEDKWWRLSYGGSAAPNIEEYTEEDVLHAAKHESKEPLYLIYASEKAVCTPSDALPQPLEKFVNWDNRTFRTEFRDEDSQTENLEVANVNVVTRELRSPTPEDEVLEGVDPIVPSPQIAQARGDGDKSIVIMPDTRSSPAPEMQERGDLPLISRPARLVSTHTIDSMDLDQVVEEDDCITNESAAVKHLGL